MKRTLQKVFSLLLCAAIMVVPAFAAGESGEVTGTPSPVMVWGNLTWLDGGGLLLTRRSAKLSCTGNPSSAWMPSPETPWI